MGCIVLANGVGWSRFYINVGWGELKWILCAEPDPENKTSRSHYKLLSKLTEICWRSLRMTSSYAGAKQCD